MAGPSVFTQPRRPAPPKRPGVSGAVGQPMPQLQTLPGGRQSTVPMAPESLPDTPQSLFNEMKLQGQRPLKVNEVHSLHDRTSGMLSTIPRGAPDWGKLRMMQRTLESVRSGLFEDQPDRVAAQPPAGAVPQQTVAAAMPSGGLGRPLQTLPGQQYGPPPVQPMQPMTAQPPQGSAYSPADNAINEVAGIAQRLRGLPTMQAERIFAESRARQNVLNERDAINAGLLNRNAGAMAGREAPMAAAQPQQGVSGLPAAPQAEPPPFATPRYGQTATQAGSAYDAARTEGALRLQNGANRILAERGDNLGSSQVARVGQNSTMLRTPDGHVNVIGNRQRQLIGDSADAGEFQQAQANAIRAAAPLRKGSSIVTSGRNQEQKDARALRAQRLYSLPGSTPAVAAATQRAKGGVAGLASSPVSFKQASTQLTSAASNPVFSNFGLNPASAKPEDWTRYLADPRVQALGDADHAQIQQTLASAYAPGMGFNPTPQQEKLLSEYRKRGKKAIGATLGGMRDEVEQTRQQGIFDSLAPVY